MSFELAHLAGDVFGLPPLSRELLTSQRELFGVSVPRKACEVPPSSDLLDRDERASLTERLTESLTPFSPHVSVLDSLHALAKPGSSVALATCGTHPFGGTLAALTAALQAIRLARSLSSEWGSEVIPMLWIDTDKIPKSEPHDAWFCSSEFMLQRVSVPASPSADQVRELRACIDQLLGHEANLEPALELCTPRAGENVSDSLVRVLLELLGCTGLVVCTSDSLRADVSHFLARIIAADPEASLKRTRATLVEAGFARDEYVFESVLVHRAAPHEQKPLHLGGDGFRYDDEPGSRTCAELAAEIVQAPTEFVPGASLLPLVQDLTLPVAIRVASRERLWEEVFRSELRDSILAPVIPVVPRVTCTLVDAETRDSLSKLGLTLREALASTDPASLPPAEELRATLDEFRALSKATSAELQRLARPLWQFDPVLRPVARRSAKEVRKSIEQLCEKAENVLNNRSGKHARHQRRVFATLKPHGLPQAKSTNLVTCMAPNGSGWITELLDEIDPFAWEHLALNFP